MLSHIATPYADTHAGHLSWRLGETRLPALAARSVKVPGGRCELRLLSASHQVLVDIGDEEVSELVTCDREDASLPAAVSHEFANATYRFRSQVSDCGPGLAAHTAEWITSAYADHPRALVGVYPGSPHAVTAVVVEPGPPLSWLTWHVYPQSGQVAATRTHLDMAESRR